MNKSHPYYPLIYALYVSILSGFATAETLHVLRQAPDVFLCSWIAGLTLCAYLWIHISARLREKAVPEPIYLILIVVVLYFVLRFAWLIRAYLPYHLLLIIAFITLGYITVLRYKGQTLSLRRIPFLKLPMIAFSFFAADILLPSEILNVSLPWYYLVAKGLFFIGICFPFDLRDINEDQSSNVRTIPAHFGAKFFSLFSIGFVAILVITFFGIRKTHSLALEGSLISLILVFLNNYLYRRFPSSTYLLLLADGQILISYLIMLVLIN